MSEPEAARSIGAPFPTTRWSRVAAAGDPADPEALRGAWRNSAGPTGIRCMP